MTHAICTAMCFNSGSKYKNCVVRVFPLQPIKRIHSQKALINFDRIHLTWRREKMSIHIKLANIINTIITQSHYSTRTKSQAQIVGNFVKNIRSTQSFAISTNRKANGSDLLKLRSVN